jgi:hypothetical protein
MEKGWTCRSPRSFPLRRDHEANLPGERAHSSNPPALRRRPTSRGRVSDGDDPWGRRREKSPRAGNDGSSTASGRSENNISWARPPRLRPRLRLQVEPPNCLPSLSRQGGVCVSVQARDLAREGTRPTDEDMHLILACADGGMGCHVERRRRRICGEAGSWDDEFLRGDVRCAGG